MMSIRKHIKDEYQAKLDAIRKKAEAEEAKKKKKMAE